MVAIGYLYRSGTSMHQIMVFTWPRMKLYLKNPCMCVAYTFKNYLIELDENLRDCFYRCQKSLESISSLNLVKNI